MPKEALLSPLSIHRRRGRRSGIRRGLHQICRIHQQDHVHDLEFMLAQSLATTSTLPHSGSSDSPAANIGEEQAQEEGEEKTKGVAAIVYSKVFSVNTFKWLSGIPPPI